MSEKFIIKRLDWISQKTLNRKINSKFIEVKSKIKENLKNIENIYTNCNNRNLIRKKRSFFDTTVH